MNVLKTARGKDIVILADKDRPSFFKVYLKEDITVYPVDDKFAGVIIDGMMNVGALDYYSLKDRMWVDKDSGIHVVLKFRNYKPLHFTGKIRTDPLGEVTGHDDLLELLKLH